MIYSKYIRDLGEKTKIPLRTIEAEWKIAEKKLGFDTMMEPNKYEHLKKMDGTYAEEVSRRVEKAILKPETASGEEKEVVPGEEAIPAATPSPDLETSPETEIPAEGSAEGSVVNEIESKPEEGLPEDSIPEESKDFAMPEENEESVKPEESEPTKTPEEEIKKPSEEKAI